MATKETLLIMYIILSKDTNVHIGSNSRISILFENNVVVVALLFYVHGKHLRSCRDGQLT